MWDISLPHWWEFVVRAVIVYALLLVLLRLSGKRQIGQLAPFDLVLLLVLSNSLQNAMVGGDNSVTGGAIAATTLLALNYGVGWIAYRSKKIEAVVEGRPVILIHDGAIDRAAMRDSQMTKHELESALRAQGCAGPDEVRFAVLETNGQVTVITKNRP
jgi:uncharacterized membrane protein YcaP (DUF421 family)